MVEATVVTVAGVVVSTVVTVAAVVVATIGVVVVGGATLEVVPSDTAGCSTGPRSESPQAAAMTRRRAKHASNPERFNEDSLEFTGRNSTAIHRIGRLLPSGAGRRERT